MIPKASQRAGGQNLATHLQNAYDNEIVEIAHLRGAVAADLHGAFKEWEVQADTLTRCRKYLYRVSVNPDPLQEPLTRDQYMDYIGRTEEALGLAGQPRAVVFHTKYGREHCHVVWSRIDPEKQKAVHLAFDHDKLMRVTRSFARDHGLELPGGYDKSRQVGQISLHELEQMRRTGITKDDRKRQVTEAWQHSDDARSFVHALAERGYILATGKRDYVLVDLYGDMNSLPKLIDDKTVRTKELRAFLDKDFPKESLPSVDEAENLVAAHRKFIEKSVSEERYAAQLAALKHRQQDRRQGLEVERDRLRREHHHTRVVQQQEHRAQRDQLRTAHRQALRQVRDERYRTRPTGLAAFLGRVSGIAFMRKAVHRYADAKRTKAYLEQREELKTRQTQERQRTDKRLSLQLEDVERRQAGLTRVDRRELAAFMRDQKADQRTRDRGGSDRMPSLKGLVEGERKEEVRAKAPDLLAAFEQAKQQTQSEAPDLIAAFDRAARSRHEDGGDGRVGSEAGNSLRRSAGENLEMKGERKR